MRWWLDKIGLSNKVGSQGWPNKLVSVKQVCSDVRLIWNNNYWLKYIFDPWYILEFCIWFLIFFSFLSIIWYLKSFVLGLCRRLSDDVSIKYLITRFMVAQKSLVFVSKSNLKWISFSLLFHPSFSPLSLPPSSLSSSWAK